MVGVKDFLVTKGMVAKLEAELTSIKGDVQEALYEAKKNQYRLVELELRVANVEQMLKQ